LEEGRWHQGGNQQPSIPARAGNTARRGDRSICASVHFRVGALVSKTSFHAAASQRGSWEGYGSGSGRGWKRLAASRARRLRGVQPVAVGQPVKAHEQQMSDDGRVNLDHYGVAALAEEAFDLEVLLESLEDQLDAPAAAVAFCDLLRRLDHVDFAAPFYHPRLRKLVLASQLLEEGEHILVRRPLEQQRTARVRPCGRIDSGILTKIPSSVFV